MGKNGWWRADQVILEIKHVRNGKVLLVTPEQWALKVLTAGCNGRLKHDDEYGEWFAHDRAGSHKSRWSVLKRGGRLAWAGA